MAFTFIGSNENDYFVGAAGDDTVVFAGDAAGYEIGYANGKAYVKDIDASDGNTGIDILGNIEILRFADRDLGLVSTVETSVSTTTSAYLYLPKAATLAGGGYVLTWTSVKHSGGDSASSVVARRYDAEGNTVGEEMIVNGAQGGSHSNSTVTALNDGGYVIAWTHYTWMNTEIRAQRFDAAGNAVGDQSIVNTTLAGDQDLQSVTALADGGYIVVWESEDAASPNDYDDVFAQRFDAAGNRMGGETLINTTTVNDQGSPVVTGLTGGGYVVAWEGVGGVGHGIITQTFDAAGNALGGEALVAAGYAKTLIALDDGGYVLTWARSNAGDDDIRMLRFDAAGNVLGGPVSLGSPAGSFWGLAVAALANGDLIAVWQAWEQDGDGYGIYAQRYDVAGNAVGGQRLVNSITYGNQISPTVTALTDGGFVIGWAAEDGSWGQGEAIYSQRFNADGEPVIFAGVEIGGTDGDDILNGGAGTQEISGRDGHDRIFGRNGDDTLIGGRGDDVLDGGGGNDILSGGLGRDTLIGGNGADVFSFRDPLMDGANVDTINHFLRADGDLIQLDNKIFTKLIKLGTLGLGRFVANADGNAVDDNDFILYETDTGNLYYDRDGNGAGEKIKFAQIGNKALLTAADFTVVSGRLPTEPPKPVFKGTNGNDNFVGGEGEDTVTFAGNAAGYEIQLTVNGRVQVKDIDTSNGDTGTDTIFRIEKLSFADRTLTLSEFTETDVTTVSSGYYYNQSPNVAVLANGGYVINWLYEDYSSSDDGEFYIYQRRYDASGNALDWSRQVSQSSADANSSSITALDDGGYLIVWDAAGWWSTLEPEGSYGVYAQRFDAAGNKVGAEAHINTTIAGGQGNPVVANLDDGGYVISWWFAEPDGSGSGIYFQRFDATGNAMGGETLVNTTTVDGQYDPAITALGGGGFLVTWTAYQSGSDEYDIHAQRFDAAGSKVGGEMRVNTTTAGFQYSQSVTALSDGGFIFAWQASGQDGSGYGIYAQRYDAAGNAVGGEAKVNTSTIGNQVEPTVTLLANGDYLIGWMDTSPSGDYNNHCMQRFDAAGNAKGGQVLLGKATYWPNNDTAITAMPDGGFLVSRMKFSAEDLDGKSDIFTWRYNASGQLMVQTMTLDGTGGDDTMNGGIGSQTLRGLTGHDTISGGSNRDILLGARGKDTLDGGQGYDDLHGGAGIDSLSGGLGVDAFIFDTLVDGLNYDIVRDFTKADVIELDNAVFAKLTATGALNANFFRANANGEALDADDYILYNTNSGQLFYDVDGTGAAGGKVLFAFVGTAVHPTMTAADFEVI